jgi:hypothetical protein
VVKTYSQRTPGDDASFFHVNFRAATSDSAVFQFAGIIAAFDPVIFKRGRRCCFITHCCVLVLLKWRLAECLLNIGGY